MSVTSDKQNITLILNCVENAVQIVLGQTYLGQTVLNTETQILFSARQSGAGQGAERLAPLIAFAFKQCGLHPQDLEKIAVVRGPGSFTGIRLGLATAAGLARSTGAQQAGLLLPHCLAQGLAPLLAPSNLAPSLLACPPQTITFANTNLLAVLTHARSNLLYLQIFRIADGKAQPLMGLSNGKSLASLAASPALQPNQADLTPNISSGLPLVLSPEQALALLKMAHQEHQDAQGLALVGSALLKHGDFFKVNLPESFLMPAAFNTPSPEALWELALTADYQTEDLEPLYLRASDAEDNLWQIAQNLGLDPTQAEAELRRLTHSANILET